MAGLAPIGESRIGMRERFLQMPYPSGYGAGSMGSVTTRLLSSTWALMGRAARAWRRVRRRPDERPPPWDADVFDDIAFNRPWNIALRYRRLQASRRIRRRPLEPGTTLVIVNWNTLAVLRDTLTAVLALTEPAVRILVIDNGSTDGSAAWLRMQDRVELMELRNNLGHAVAVDLALLRVGTDIAVLLDSDAVPLHSGWLTQLELLVRRERVVLAGTESSRGFVHPMFMALDVAAFINRALTFAVHIPGTTPDTKQWGVTDFDTGEWLSRMVAPDELAFLDTTKNPVDGLPGMTVGHAVYHHGGVTRANEDGLDPESYAAWRAALEAVLPEEAR